MKLEYSSLYNYLKKIFNKFKMRDYAEGLGFPVRLKQDRRRRRGGRGGSAEDGTGNPRAWRGEGGSTGPVLAAFPFLLLLPRQKPDRRGSVRFSLVSVILTHA